MTKQITYNENTMTTAVYIRISTSDQNLAAQRAEISRWLSGHQITDAVWYEDTSTGTDLDRPGFTAMQRAVFLGEVKTIVVWKLDRLSRSMVEGLTVLSTWLDSGIRFVATTQQFDFSGTVGKMVAALLLGVAQMETETRKERQAAGIAIAKASGVYRGRLPGSTQAKPSEAKAHRAKGLTVPQIAVKMDVSERTITRYLAAGHSA